MDVISLSQPPERHQLRKDGKNKDGAFKPNALLSSSHAIGKAYPVEL